jgi:hypothetical protein
VIALLSLSLILLNAFTFFLAIVPLATGRYVYQVLHIPGCFRHDPMAFIFGLWVWMVIVWEGYQLQVWRLLTHWQWLTKRSVYPTAFKTG